VARGAAHCIADGRIVTDSGLPEIPTQGEPFLSPPPEALPSAPDLPAPSGTPWPTDPVSSAAPPVPPAFPAQPPYAAPPSAPPALGAQDNPNNAPVRVGFIEAIKRAYSKYATFSGRASRSEYWWFILFQQLVSIPLALLILLISNQLGSASTTSDPTGNLAVSGIGNLWSLVNFIPILAVTWRRLHDSNKSGWWYGAGMIGGVVATVVLAGAFIAHSVSNCSDESGCDVNNFAAPSAGLIGLVAVVALAYIAYAITMLVLVVRRGNEGANRYGPGYVTASNLGL